VPQPCEQPVGPLELPIGLFELPVGPRLLPIGLFELPVGPRLLPTDRAGAVRIARRPSRRRTPGPLSANAPGAQGIVDILRLI
jgi:hypothetical protein